MSEPSAMPVAVDSSAPSPARIWDFYLGGKDSYAADRAVAERVIAVLPTAPLVARLTRRFLVTVVADLAAQGIRQFLDIGSGLPTADNTHQVAQRAAAESRVVYVDSDPVAITHARALLASAPAGACDYLRADVRDVDAIVSGASRTLDLSRPVAVLMIQLLHFIPDEDDPYQIVARIMDAVPPGSFLVLVHGASDVDLDAAAALTKMAQASPVPLRLRSREEVARFFDGLELTGPGLVSGTEWLDPLACTAFSGPPGFSYGYSGVARKP
jgi:O-methyltransferase involved in polyketide biosynthesis